MPTRYRILISRRVGSDLESLFKFIAEDSPKNAAAFVQRILSAVEGLKTSPHRTVVDGQNPRSRHPVRSLPMGSHVLFFRVVEEHKLIRLLQIRPGAQRRIR